MLTSLSDIFEVQQGPGVYLPEQNTYIDDIIAVVDGNGYTVSAHISETEMADLMDQHRQFILDSPFIYQQALYEYTCNSSKITQFINSWVTHCEAIEEELRASYGLHAPSTDYDALLGHTNTLKHKFTFFSLFYLFHDITISDPASYKRQAAEEIYYNTNIEDIDIACMELEIYRDYLATGGEIPQSGAWTIQQILDEHVRQYYNSITTATNNDSYLPPQIDMSNEEHYITYQICVYIIFFNLCIQRMSVNAPRLKDQRIALFRYTSNMSCDEIGRGIQKLPLSWTYDRAGSLSEWSASSACVQSMVISHDTPMIIITPLSAYKYQKEIITPQGLFLERISSQYRSYNFGLDINNNVVKPENKLASCHGAVVGADVAILRPETIQDFFSNVLPTIYYNGSQSSIIDTNEGVLTPCGWGVLDDPNLYKTVYSSNPKFPDIGVLIARMRSTQDC